MAEITILLPHGEVDDAQLCLAPRPPSLQGKRVGFLDNELWRSMRILTDELSRILSEEHGVAGVEVMSSGPIHGSCPREYRERLEKFAGRVDAVISGLGN